MEVQIGMKLGHLTVLRYVEDGKHGQKRVEVQCDCGEKSVINLGNLILNPNRHCRYCCHYYSGINNRKLLQPGTELNGWLVLGEGQMIDNKFLFPCKCDRCGNVSMRSYTQVHMSKKAYCENCGPQYAFSIMNGIAKGTLSDGSHFLIDEEDIERVSKYYWHIDKDGYVVSQTREHKMFLHRFIFGALPKRKGIVDHINRDRRDCRKSNLRVADCHQNSANHGLFCTNKTGYTGVFFSTSAHRYEVKIGYQNRRIRLGSSKDNIILLAQMYNIAAKYFYGEYAGALNDVPMPSEELIEAIEAKCRKYEIRIKKTA